MSRSSTTWRQRKGLPRRLKKLPKTFCGVPVARGRGLSSERFDELEHEKSCDDWPIGGFYVVVPTWIDRITEMKVFKDKADAVTYAKGLSNGNVDHRVLRCTSELLVIATENEL